MVVDEVLQLIDSGAVIADKGSISSGLAMGGRALYARATHDQRFSFHGVDYTHDPRVLAGNRQIGRDQFSLGN